jgi:hypothetical protein
MWKAHLRFFGALAQRGWGCTPGARIVHLAAYRDATRCEERASGYWLGVFSVAAGFSVSGFLAKDLT